MERLISAQTAAKRLGVSRTTLTKYTKTGILPSERHGKTVKYPVDCVEELRKELDQGFKAANLRGDVAVLKYRLRKVECLLKFLMFKLELQTIPVQFSDADLLYYYKMSTADIPKELRTNKAYKWLEVAMVLTENEYARMEALTGDVYPWRKFFDYADGLIAKLKKKRSFKTSPEVQQLTQDLALAQQEIRRCGVVMLSARPGKMPASERFDILVSRVGKEVDPAELVADIQDPQKLTPKEAKRVRQIQSELRAGPAGLPEETR